MGRGYVYVTNSCMCNCRLRKKFSHGTLLAEINNAVDDGALFTFDGLQLLPYTKA